MVGLNEFGLFYSTIRTPVYPTRYIWCQNRIITNYVKHYF